MAQASILGSLLAYVLFLLMFQAAYVAVMQTVNASNRTGYESLLRIYRETDLSQEKTRILSNHTSFFIFWSSNECPCLQYSCDTFVSFLGSLASCPDPNIILEVLNFLLSSEVVYFLRILRTHQCQSFACNTQNSDFVSIFFRFVVKMPFLDLVLVGKHVKQLGRGLRWYTLTFH